MLKEWNVIEAMNPHSLSFVLSVPSIRKAMTTKAGRTDNGLRSLARTACNTEKITPIAKGFSQRDLAVQPDIIKIVTATNEFSKIGVHNMVFMTRAKPTSAWAYIEVLLMLSTS